jgi:hypothetical protein
MTENSISHEYGLSNGNGNGNGHANGNGKGIFGLTPKEDPVLAHQAPQARRKVNFNNKLSFGARVLYTHIIDCALWTGVCTRKGVVRFANSYLAERFGVSEKTIQNWKRELREIGEIWTTEKRMKNSFPMTVYNVTALLGQPMLPMAIETEDGSLAEDEIFSNRNRPRRLERNGHGKFVAGGYKTPEISKSGETAQNPVLQATAEKIMPSSAAKNCRPQRQPIAAHSGKNLPSSAETDCRSERQKSAALGGKNLPLSAAKNCRGERQPIADKGESLNGVKSLEAGGSPPTNPQEEAFKAWDASLNGRFPSQLERMLKKFQEDLKVKGWRLTPAGKELLKRKIARLVSVLEGPVPEWAEPRPAEPAKPAGPKVSDSELANRGKELAAAMRAAL